MSTPEQRLADRGIQIPSPAKPVASYVPTVRTGNYVYVSGQVATVDGKPVATGRLGVEVSLEDGVAAARACAVNVIAALKAELGELSRIARVVKLTGFVASDPGFTGQPKVVNGASDLLVEAFGDAGMHARSAIGVAALPLNVPVEVEAIVEVTPDA